MACLILGPYPCAMPAGVRYTRTLRLPDAVGSFPRGAPSAGFPPTAPDCGHSARMRGYTNKWGRGQWLPAVEKPPGLCAEGNPCSSSHAQPRPAPPTPPPSGAIPPGHGGQAWRGLCGPYRPACCDSTGPQSGLSVPRIGACARPAEPAALRLRASGTRTLRGLPMLRRVSRRSGARCTSRATAGEALAQGVPRGQGRQGLAQVCQ